jgi:hypothetical protein
MRLFGFTIPVLVLVALAFFMGARNPGWLARIPIVRNI